MICGCSAVSLHHVRGFYFMTCFDQKSFLSQFLIIVPSYSARIFQYPIQQFIQHLPDLLSRLHSGCNQILTGNRQFPDRKTHSFFSMHSRYICSYASNIRQLFPRAGIPLCARISARLTATMPDTVPRRSCAPPLRTAFRKAPDYRRASVPADTPGRWYRCRTSAGWRRIPIALIVKSRRLKSSRSSAVNTTSFGWRPSSYSPSIR